jgi:hypothetical protein
VLGLSKAMSNVQKWPGVIDLKVTPYAIVAAATDRVESNSQHFSRIEFTTKWRGTQQFSKRIGPCPTGKRMGIAPSWPETTPEIQGTKPAQIHLDMHQSKGLVE